MKRRTNIKPVLGLLLLAGLAFAFYWFALRQPPEEEVIAGRIAKLCEAADRAENESQNSGLLKAASMRGFFTPQVTLRWPEYGYSGEVDVAEIIQGFTATRQYYSRARFAVSELNISVTAPDIADADFVLGIEGHGRDGTFSDARIVHSTWYKVDGTWRIGRASVQPIIGF